MGCIDIDAREVAVGGAGQAAPAIYVVDSIEHPFDVATLADGLAATVVTLPVRDWDDALTPWPAPGLYRESPDFGGHADETLAGLVAAMPQVEAAEGLHPTYRAICGYSLGGLFALYALTHAVAFEAAACLSGSVWYEGWVEHLRTLDFDASGRYAFLSLGRKEKRAPMPIMKRVEERMVQCASILREHGCETDFVIGPGNHMQHVEERFSAGLTALDAWLFR